MWLLVDADNIPGFSNDLVMSITSDMRLGDIMCTHDHFELATPFNHDWPTAERVRIQGNQDDGIEFGVHDRPATR